MSELNEFVNVPVHIHWQENLYHSDLYIRICNPNIRPLKQMQTFIVLILIIVTGVQTFQMQSMLCNLRLKM